MGDILGAKYTNYANDDADYPVITSIKKVGYMPVPRPTIASQAPALAREKALAEVSLFSRALLLAHPHLPLPLLSSHSKRNLTSP